ncbi:MAG: hypothetical protein AD073_000300 [Mycoplasmataceae bacterium]|nr:MAG: hypothetical protein AD073_000300 [Mycoplasmataceae bacterium]
MNKKSNYSTIFLVNWRNDQKLFFQALSNSNILLEDFEFELDYLSFDENLMEELNELIKKSQIFPTREKLNFTGLTYSLVSKWELYKEKLGLLDSIVELTIRIARGHYFLNGNKITSLIVMNSFLNSCGYSLRNLIKNSKGWIYEEKWERLFLNIADSSISEELAIDLLKERVWMDITIYEKE